VRRKKCCGKCKIEGKETAWEKPLGTTA